MLAKMLSDSNARLAKKTAVANHAEDPETVGYTTEAAATALNAAYLREREARFGNVVPRVTAFDKAVDAVSSALERDRARTA